MFPLAIRSYHYPTGPDTVSPYVIGVASVILILLAIDNLFCRQQAVDRTYRSLLGAGDLFLGIAFILILKDKMTYGLSCFGLGAVTIAVANIVNVVVCKKAVRK